MVDATDFTTGDYKGLHLIQKGNTWQAVITTVGPAGFVRFIGVFATKFEAALALAEAKEQRENDQGVTNKKKTLTSVDHIDKVWEAKILSLKRKCRSKASGPDDVNDFLELLDDSEIVDEIRHCFAPLQTAGQPFLHWGVSKAPVPESLAMLLGLNGEIIPISSSHVVLGRTISSKPLRLAKGMVSDPQLGVNTLANTSALVGVRVDMLPELGEVIHIGEDASIAHHHASIAWNEDANSFCINALTESGLFVDEMILLPSEGALMIKPQTKIQIGCKIFYFALNIFAPLNMVSQFIGYVRFIL